MIELPFDLTENDLCKLLAFFIVFFFMFFFFMFFYIESPAA